MLLMREVLAYTIYLLVHGKYNYPLSLLMINEDSVVTVRKDTVGTFYSEAV